MAIQPGWYADPTDDSLRRWWDGSTWTEHVTRERTTGPLPPPAPAAPSRQRRRLPVWAWVVIGLVAIGVAVLVSPLIAAAALAVLITGIVALAKGSPTWLRFRSRRAAAAVTAAAAAAFLVFGSVTAVAYPGRSNGPAEAARFADSSPTSDSDDPAETRSEQTPTPTPVTTVSEEAVTEVVPFEEATIEDPAMAKGETKVTTVGIAGERTLTYRVTSVDGEETKRELISDVVTTEPITQVTSVGTYVAPPPPPPPPAQPAGCDSNYADACVPVAADVDCAGGSGNGPAYFDGIARVVGSDIYELDRDGDGYACEPN